MPENPRTQSKRRRRTDIVSQNVTKRHRAAVLLAEDELTDEAIASEVGIQRRTLARWKNDPEFAALVGDYHGQIIAQALKLPIAKKHKRIEVLNALHDKYLAIIEQRGETYAKSADTPEEAARQVFGSETVPWSSTGMMVQQPKIAANGKTVVEWAFDKALDSAIKETHKQAAQELGQWVDRSEQEQTTTTLVQIIGDDDDDEDDD